MTRHDPVGAVAPPLLSVVIPALNEAGRIGALLDDLGALDVPHEVIVVDGGSTDATVRMAEQHGARVVQARRGRGTQLAAGARVARAPVLCFLHADVRLPAPARRELASLARSGATNACVFRFRIDAEGWRYRVIEFGTQLRVRLFRLPYGDQGLVVSRADYDTAGGYDDVPLMEDVAIIDRLRRVTTIRVLGSSLPAAARRWELDGAFTGVLRNWRIMLAYRLGASAEQLAARYRPQPEVSRVAGSRSARG